MGTHPIFESDFDCQQTMSEKEPDNPPVEEDEDSGDDDDMGKYMIDDDDEQPEQKHPLEKNELLTSSDLRKYMAESVPSLNRKRGLKLPVHGNERTMNLNHLILANITESAYFRTDLVQFRQFDELVDEIYYRANHLEPWEKGSRKHFTGSTTGGERGMAYSSIPGVSNYVGVRGVGQGGIVSTPFCCLYKLWTLKLNRKQIDIMINHTDSPYIRGIGFLYLRFSIPPDQLLEFFEPYFYDEEEVDPKAGGGDPMTIGQMVQNMLEDNIWYGTMFPRIPAKHLQEIRNSLNKVRGRQSSRHDRVKNGDRAERSRSPQEKKKKRRDPRDLDDRPSSSSRYGFNSRSNDRSRQDRRDRRF